MGKGRSYTDEEFRIAVEESRSFAQVLKRLGLQPTGGNYEIAKRRVAKLGLKIDHFAGQGYLKGASHNWAKRIPLEVILVKNSSYGGGTHKLKNRLLKAGLLERKCYAEDCGLVTWKGKPIPLELEHRNDDRFDCRIENLILLCPNCHALTETYRGKNKRKRSTVINQ